MSTHVETYHTKSYLERLPVRMRYWDLLLLYLLSGHDDMIATKPSLPPCPYFPSAPVAWTRTSHCRKVSPLTARSCCLTASVATPPVAAVPVTRMRTSHCKRSLSWAEGPRYLIPEDTSIMLPLANMIILLLAWSLCLLCARHVQIHCVDKNSQRVEKII